MVSMQEQLPCRVSWRNSNQRFQSRNSISRNAGVWCLSESKSARARERECVFGDRVFGGPGLNNYEKLAFSPSFFAEEEEG